MNIFELCTAILQDFGHPKNRCWHTQLNVCEKERFPCFLYLIQIFGVGIIWILLEYASNETWSLSILNIFWKILNCHRLVVKILKFKSSIQVRSAMSRMDQIELQINHFFWKKNFFQKIIMVMVNTVTCVGGEGGAWHIEKVQ